MTDPRPWQPGKTRVTIKPDKLSVFTAEFAGKTGTVVEVEKIGKGQRLTPAFLEQVTVTVVFDGSDRRICLAAGKLTEKTT